MSRSGTGIPKLEILAESTKISSPCVTAPADFGLLGGESHEQ